MILLIVLLSVPDLAGPFVKRFSPRCCPESLPNPSSLHSAFGWLPVVALAVFASPLPARGSAGTAPAPIRAEHILSSIVQADLRVILIYQDDPKEHAFLAIDNTAVHACVSKIQLMTSDTILIPEKTSTLRVQNTTKGTLKTMPIGKASFVSREHKENVINEMINVKMPPFNQKGTCVDYIRIVLQKFKDRGIIVDSVLESYETIYKERYQAGYERLGVAPGERTRR
ncbi:uncharacterized protein C8R40DRAFT_1240492 [Lentinula edodes]|uniref:uncharacterized protein n=1 Tax=Lentinula edodes TaxID=5353 RepID=UPI001E8CE7C1|nr:uncharacterized protein C8R40DRAFT_1240492 [Lentinula edodes]KAH7870267.1 hypothetical protein C8R40DRAFT_1240492 [Lentinula edodes]